MSAARVTCGLVLLLALALAPGCGGKPVPGAATDPEDAKARLRSVNNLLMIGMSFESYGTPDDPCPPLDGSRVGGKPELAGLSWRTYISGQMNFDTGDIQGQQMLEGLAKGDYPPKAGGEPWDRPKLAALELHPWASPVKGKTAEPWLTYYRAFVGPGTAFERGRKTKFGPAEFPDGRGNTILVVEAAEAVPWPKPQELEYDPNKPVPKIGGLFPDGAYAVMADSSIVFIPRDYPEEKLRALITRNGGEKVDPLPLVDRQALRKAAGLKDD